MVKKLFIIGGDFVVFFILFIICDNNGLYDYVGLMNYYMILMVIGELLVKMVVKNFIMGINLVMYVVVVIIIGKLY